MKLNLIGLLLTIGTTLGGELTAAKYTITNAQYTGGMLSASSLLTTDNRPYSSNAMGDLSKSATDLTNDDTSNKLKTWELNSVGNGHWTLRNAVTRQYLVPQGYNSLKFSSSSPFPWKILPLPGDLYVITCANSQYALSLRSPDNEAQIDLLPATGAVTQNWVFTKVD